MSSRWNKVACGVLVLGLLSGAGCAEPPRQREVVAAGTPTHLAGNALVLLPRTCVRERRMASHQLPPSDVGTRTTHKLRRAIDTMVSATNRADPEPIHSCKPPPDLSSDPARLSELRASEHTLRLLRERRLDLAVVIEIQATLACSPGWDGVRLTHYAGGRVTSSTINGDVCDNDEIELIAYVFRRDGKAVWAGMREIVAGEPVEPAIERLLQRVPVTMPLSVKRAGTADLRCVVEDRGITICS